MVSGIIDLLLIHDLLTEHSIFCMEKDFQGKVISLRTGETNLTVDEMRNMILSNDHQSFMSKLMYYAKNVTGTNAY